MPIHDAEPASAAWPSSAAVLQIALSSLYSLLADSHLSGATIAIIERFHLEHGIDDAGFSTAQPWHALPWSLPGIV